MNYSDIVALSNNLPIRNTEGAEEFCLNQNNPHHVGTQNAGNFELNLMPHRLTFAKVRQIIPLINF